MDARSLIRRLGLEPLEQEGGWFRETHRDADRGTAIYYLLAEGEKSLLHRLSMDEVWHFYAGDPVELFVFRDGACEKTVLSGSLAEGTAPQAVVPAGAWQGARLALGGSFALMGTTVSPAFVPSRFELAGRREMSLEFPGFEELIGELTGP